MKIQGKRGKYAEVSVDEIEIDNGPNGYQRPQFNNSVARIVKAFNWESFGVVTLSKRQSKYFVIDGGHRWTAAKEIGAPKVPALVYEGLSRLREAEIFLAINTGGKKPTPIQKWRASLIAQDPTALRIQQTLNKHGFTIGEKQNLNVFNCPAHLELVDGRACLDGILGFIRVTWPESEERTLSAVLLGCTTFLSKTSAAIGDSFSAEKFLKSFEGSNLTKLHSRAKYHAQCGETAIKNGFVMALAEHWNKVNKNAKIQVSMES